MTTFGLIAKKRMLEKNMTLTELASAVDCRTPSYIADIFTGYKSGAKYLDKIHSVLEIDRSEIEDKFYAHY